MEFFDPKEEVIDLQLTPYGKRLLSEGKFKPDQYAFFDDDILYDLDYANASGSYYEIQNKTEDRITKETPRTKAQYAFLTPEIRLLAPRNLMRAYGDSDVKLAVEWSTMIGLMPEQSWESLGIDIGEGAGYADFQTVAEQIHGWAFELSAIKDIWTLTDKKYEHLMPIGHSSLSSDYIPAWDIDFLYGNMEYATPHYTGSYFNTAPARIPQLETTVEYEVYTSRVDNHGELIHDFVPEKLKFFFDGDEPSTPANDGTVLQVRPDYLLLEVEEKNTDFLKNNFDIEVFSIVETGEKNIKGDDVAVLEPLEFYNPQLGKPITKGNVEYWFDISVDESILSEYFCASSIVTQRKKSRLADSILPYPEDCPEYNQPKNLYMHETIDIEEPC